MDPFGKFQDDWLIHRAIEQYSSNVRLSEEIIEERLGKDPFMAENALQNAILTSNGDATKFVSTLNTLRKGEWDIKLAEEAGQTLFLSGGSFENSKFIDPEKEFDELKNIDVLVLFGFDFNGTKYAQRYFEQLKDIIPDYENKQIAIHFYETPGIVRGQRIADFVSAGFDDRVSANFVDSEKIALIMKSRLNTDRQLSIVTDSNGGTAAYHSERRVFGQHSDLEYEEKEIIASRTSIISFGLSIKLEQEPHQGPRPTTINIHNQADPVAWRQNFAAGMLYSDDSDAIGKMLSFKAYRDPSHENRFQIILRNVPQGYDEVLNVAGHQPGCSIQAIRQIPILSNFVLSAVDGKSLEDIPIEFPITVIDPEKMAEAIEKVVNGRSDVPRINAARILSENFELETAAWMKLKGMTEHPLVKHTSIER